jgi:hypothetical protein
MITCSSFFLERVKKKPATAATIGSIPMTISCEPPV